MKPQFSKWLLLLLVFSFSLQFYAQADNPRSVALFNFDWKFHFGEADQAESRNFDDSSWKSLSIPHDFQIEQPWNEKGSRARGFKDMSTAWYRKSFSANPAWKNKMVIIDFEGLLLYGEIYLNGNKIIDVNYGYLGGRADISKLLDYDKPNVLAVHASTGQEGNSRWYTGGGLFRDVHLIVKNPISIAENGIYITTPEVSEQKAKIQLQTTLEGLTNKDLDISIEAHIFDPNGKEVAQTSLPAPKRNKLKLIEVDLPAITLANPQLWSCESPNLYNAQFILKQNGKIIDQLSETFGIRSVEFSKEFGLKLNGKKVFLKGIANHHDLGALGAAVYDDAIERLFIQLKAFGFNHVRTSHNPYSKSFMKLADKHGILIVDELTDKWSDRDFWFGKKPFTEMWFEMVPEWVKRDRNHPSVILWSFGNELQIREDWAGFPTGDWGVTTYKILEVLLKRYDSSRRTTVAMFPARANALYKNDPDFNTKVYPPELATVTDIASFNYRYLNYADYLKHAPDMIIYQSEATTNELLAPYFGMDLDKMVGLAYWGAVEYWGESNGWPKKGWNYSYFNHALGAFPQAYLIKSAFSEAPLVHIGVIDKAIENVEWNAQTIGTEKISSHWNREKGKNYHLYTYTNAEEVELFVNNKSLGIQKNNTTDINERNKILWKNIPYEAGTIVAVARNNHKEVARNQLETAGKAVKLKVVVENQQQPWQADGMNLRYLRLYAVDSKGRVVPDFNENISIDVQGAARLRTLDNGDHNTDELFNENHILMHKGFALATLCSNQSPGKLVFKANAKGLKGISLNLETK